MGRHTVPITECLVIFIMLFSSEASAKVKVKKLLVTTQISSWIEQKEITKKFPAQGLFDIINGGAVEYIDRGLLEGIHQQFTNKDGKTVEVFVEDFGVAEKAGAMLDAKKQSLSEIKQLTAPSGMKCFASKAIGAVVVIASLEHFYIEMTVSGFSDDSESKNVAAAFLDHYQQRIK